MILFAFITSLFAGVNYYGGNSQEAILKFKAKAEIPFEYGISVSNPSAQKLELVKEELRYQVDHLIGHFQSNSFYYEFGYKGVLGEYYDLEIIKLEKIDNNRLIVEYKFSGKVVFEALTFKKNKKVKVPLRMPLAYDKIYELGMEKGKNRCTDLHYNSEDDFWYFWDIELPGCPLNGNKEDVLHLEGELTAIANTKLTYPEYDLLYGDNGNKENLEISIFLGYIEPIRSSGMNYNDDGYLAYKSLAHYFEKNEKFEEVDSLEKFAIDNDGELVQGISYLKEFEKVVRNKFGLEMKVKIKLLLSNTELAEDEQTFHLNYTEALVKSDVVIYDGHSGLGANLNFNNLPEFNFKKNKYQVFYFNGCSSYPYYNGEYFDKKGGTEYLDILTSGLPTFSATIFGNLVEFIEPIMNGRFLSYQTMLKNIEKTNEEFGTYLLGVNGDEDNKFSPKN